MRIESEMPRVCGEPVNPEIAPPPAELDEPSLLSRYLVAGKNIVQGLAKIVANGDTGATIREISHHQF